MNTLDIDIRTGLRAAVAVALASGVAHLFALQRSYWVIMVAVVVLTETWGASIQKAVQRVGATAAGCMIGWAFERVVGHSQWVETGLMLLCIFLAIYYRGYSYPWMMFWITIYVVFLFALLGEWSLATALLRLKDTMIGGAVAIAATMIIPPARAHQLRNDLTAIWKCAQAQLAASLAAIVPIPPPAEGPDTCRDNLYRAVEALRAHLALAPYENIARPRTVERIREIVEQTEALGHQVLVIALVQPGSSDRLRPLFPELQALAQAALESIHRLSEDAPGLQARDVHDCCKRVEARAAELERDGEMGTPELLWVFSLTSHLAQIASAVDGIREGRRKLTVNAEVPRAIDVALAK